MTKDHLVYIEDILDSIAKINAYTKDMSFSEFKNDSKTQDAVVRNFEIIGEAARQIPPDIKKKNPKVPWKAMIGMRNKMIHEYAGVVLEVVWKTLKEDLPGLEKQLKEIFRRYNKSPKLFK